MPAKSKSQQQLFGIALAARRGEIEKSEVTKDVKDIVNSKMTDKQIRDFAKTKHKGLPEYVKESMVKKEYGFIVIKPGSLQYSGEIIKLFEENGFDIEQLRVKKLTFGEAKNLYKVHKKESFYKDLCKYMSSDTSIGIILSIDADKIDSFSNVFTTIAMLKDEIRKKYKESDMRNVLHSSDNKENMNNEAKYYFPYFGFDKTVK